MKTWTLFWEDGGEMCREEFYDLLELKYFVNNHVDFNITVKVVENTWKCVCQTPNLWKTPFEIIDED